MILLPFLVVLPAVIAQGCDDGWKLFDGQCYKHFMDIKDPVNYAGGEARCQKHGGHLSTVSSKAELDFLGDLTRQPGMRFGWSGLPLLGALRMAGGEWYYNWSEPTVPWFGWCEGKPNNYQDKENCVILITDHVVDDANEVPPGPPCLDDALCNGDYHGNPGYWRYVCKKPQGRTCSKDYIDITETDVPERRKYKKGEKCIPKDPCRDVKDMTITYIVDSSKSIGAENWEALVKFLQSGANFLHSRTKVGFVKYSTNVTFAEFLEPGWSKSDFKKFVPKEFENGQTNTPAAFDKAREMFKNDDSKKQVAVLITDGLPFSMEHDSPDEMYDLTKKSAKNLRNSGVALIALGYGDELHGKNAKVLRSWLEDPEEDYFEYDKQSRDFKSMHMSILMRKVCRRYVKY